MSVAARCVIRCGVDITDAVETVDGRPLENEHFSARAAEPPNKELSATPSSPFRYDVFLCHNHEDKGRVRAIAQELRGAGLEVWFDEWVVTPGEDVLLSVERGLEASRALVLCMTPASMQSSWVEFERSTTLFRDPKNKDRRFIPLLLEDTPLPDTVRRYKHIDYRESGAQAFSVLVASCRAGDRATQGNAQLRRARKVAPFVILALLALAAAVAIMTVMASGPEAMVQLGLTGKRQQLMLPPLGLATSVLTFSILKSYAIAVGRFSQRRFPLGVAAMAGLSAVLLGLVLMPVVVDFAITVFVHSQRSGQKAALQTGTLVLDVEPGRLRAEIDEAGAAKFVGIPANLWGRHVPVLLETEDYELANSSATLALTAKRFDLQVQPRKCQVMIHVTDQNGSVVSGVDATLEGEGTIQKLADGSLAVTLPCPKPPSPAVVTFRAPGQRFRREYVHPRGGNMDVRFEGP